MDKKFVGESGMDAAVFELPPGIYPSEFKPGDKRQFLEWAIGWFGKMIGGSKSGYSSQHPDNLVVFNANICTKKEKIWHGDIDVTKELDSLTTAAKGVKEDIYVLYEMDARFENEKKPLLDKAVVKVSPDGKVVLMSKDHYEMRDGKILKKRKAKK